MKRYLCATAILVAVSVVLLSGQVATAANWYDDFNDGNAGDGNPVTWTPSPFTPGIFDASSGDYVLEGIDPNNNDESLVSTVDSDVFTDVSIRTQILLQGGGEVGGVVGHFNPATFSGYAAVISEESYLQLIRSDGGALTELTHVFPAPGVDATRDFLIEMDIFGSTINVTAWNPGMPKPAPQISGIVDATYASGVAGVVFNESSLTGSTGTFRFAQAQDTVIPEPTSFGLALLGGLLAVARCRRRYS